VSRAFHHREFALDDLVVAKGDSTVSVCLPARNEASTVGAIVEVIHDQLVERAGLVDELLVVDDGSTDETAAVATAAGAKVLTGTGEGKGDAMWRSLQASTGDLVVWCDADVTNFDGRFVTGLLGPLLTNDDVMFVKGFYERPLDGRPGKGGRVTQLVARPLISLLFPALTPILQPLAGECAGRRNVLESVPFVSSYGVDLALLIDVASAYGVASIAQVDLGERVHRNRTLEELSVQSLEILQAALARAGFVSSPGGALDPPPRSLERPEAQRRGGLGSRGGDPIPARGRRPSSEA
jgi:glucosyl-3-phosphoglycerate synthase